MSLEERIELLTRLGTYLASEDEYLHAIMHRTAYNNQWLTIENSKKVAKGMATAYLTKEHLLDWVAKFEWESPKVPKKVGIVPTGNIPLIGLLDIISTFLAGHISLVKPTSVEEYILPHLLKKMMTWEPKAAPYFELKDFLKGFDAIITMTNGKKNPYYSSYFSKFPHIIREERHSVAILDGKETDAELLALGNDVFANFGLGNENVSKIYVPEG